MDPRENLLRVYRELADWYEKQRPAADASDRFLVLAADAAALTAGRPDEAERLRLRLLKVNPHHMVKPYATFAEALKAPDVLTYVKDLRVNYPADVAEDLLRTLQGGEKAPPAGVPMTAPVMDIDGTLTSPMPGGESDTYLQAPGMEADLAHTVPPPARSTPRAPARPPGRNRRIRFRYRTNPLRPARRHGPARRPTAPPGPRTAQGAGGASARGTGRRRLLVRRPAFHPGPGVRPRAGRIRPGPTIFAAGLAAVTGARMRVRMRQRTLTLRVAAATIPFRRACPKSMTARSATAAVVSPGLPRGSVTVRAGRGATPVALSRKFGRASRDGLGHPAFSHVEPILHRPQPRRRFSGGGLDARCPPAARRRSLRPARPLAAPPWSCVSYPSPGTSCGTRNP